MFYKITIAISAIILAISTVIPEKAIADDNIDLLAFAIGYYDINDDKEAKDLRLECRFGTPVFMDIRPWLGLEITSDNAIYANGGVLYELKLTENTFFVPSFGAGLYSDGNGKDLGSTIEFRTQMEFQYKFENQNRISIAASHISNAEIGNTNPGTEILSVYYQIPINSIFELSVF